MSDNQSPPPATPPPQSNGPTSDAKRPASPSPPVKGTAKPTGKDGGAPTDKPADDRLREDSNLTNAAYKAGRQSFRVDGNAAFADKSRIKNLQVGNRYDYKIFPDTGTKKTSGIVRAAVLREIRETYALVPMYERMLDTLRTHRVVLLRGMPDTGLSTTAVRLLDEVTDGNVARLDLTGGVQSIRDKDLTKKRGYLIRDPAEAPTGIVLDAFSELLGKRQCYCVLLDTASVERDELDGYAFGYQPPDWRDLLHRHIAWRLRPDDPEETEQRLMDVAEGDELREVPGPDHRPEDIVRLAGLLVRHGRGELDLGDVALGYARRVPDQVADWFTTLRNPQLSGKNKNNEALGLAAFRIALAVLNISSYADVLETAELLERLMVTAIDPASEKPRTSGGFLDQQRTLAACRAHGTPGRIIFGSGAGVECEFAEYRDDRFPSAVLGHVWQEYGWMRPVLVEWLTELGAASSPMVWVRAAQAAGLLSALEFHSGYVKLIAPGAYSPDDHGMRRFAAVALDQAAQDSRARDVVRAFLRDWRRWGGQPVRWTAATALGYGIGLADIDTALRELRVLGTPDESLDALKGPSWDEMVAVVSESVSRLLAFGAVEKIVATLTDWLRHRRTSMRVLAQRTVERLIDLRGADLMYLDFSAGRDHPPIPREHERWPLLLVLQNDDHRLTEPVAELLRLALRGRDADGVADHFRDWIRTGEEDLGCLMVLVRFLPRLVRTADDAIRLNHLVSMLRRDWAEPLSPEVAAELETAIRSAIPDERQPWTPQTVT